MIENLKAQFLDRGLAPEQIHAEEFGFAKLGRTRSSDVGRAGTARTVRDGPPPETRRRSVVILWALAFAAVTFALGILVGRQTDGSAESTSRSEPGSTRAGQGSASAGKDVFTSAGCGDCHTMAAAGSTATVDPNLDDTRPDAALVQEVVVAGRGAMPAFGQELSEQEIRDLAAFVSESAGG